MLGGGGGSIGRHRTVPVAVIYRMCLIFGDGEGTGIDAGAAMQRPRLSRHSPNLGYCTFFANHKERGETFVDRQNLPGLLLNFV